LEERVVPAGDLIQVTNVMINGGAAQRSMVTSIQVGFSQPPKFASEPAAAFELIRLSDKSEIKLYAEAKEESILLTFKCEGKTASLPDGRYWLRVIAREINGGMLDGNQDGVAGDDYRSNSEKGLAIFRLFGDSNGDGRVDLIDFARMRQSLGSRTYDASLDANGDGRVDLVDFVAFRERYGASI